MKYTDEEINKAMDLWGQIKRQLRVYNDADVLSAVINLKKKIEREKGKLAK